MPNLIIEFSRELAGDDQIQLLLNAVHQAAMASGLFVESHIRTRAIPIDHYLTGGVDAPFIHAQLRIKAGRDQAQKKALSEAVLQAIRQQGWSAQVTTVEVVDMDGSSYARYSLIDDN
jgi:5-carboxymethyl-2-hydroxymuconate isomerase